VSRGPAKRVEAPAYHESVRARNVRAVPRQLQLLVRQQRILSLGALISRGLLKALSLVIAMRVNEACA